MSWAKADDRYDDTSKIKRAWRLSGYAVGLHWMSVTSCARHESDGLVDPEWLAERLGVIPKKDAEKALETLVALGLYEPLAAGERRTVFDKHGNSVHLGPAGEDTYIVHDYLLYQESAATLEAKRGDERLRKAIAARAKEVGLSITEYRKTPAFRADFPPDSERKPAGIRAGSEDPDPTRPDPTRPDPATAGRAGEHPLAVLVTDVLAIFAQCQRLRVERVGVENAIAAWPDRDYRRAAHTVVTWASDPAFRTTNAAKLLGDALSKQKAEPAGTATAPTDFAKYDRAARRPRPEAA